MCIDVRKQCQCGRAKVQFFLKDNVMLPEVLSRLFCPKCPGDEPFDEEAMLADNGWVIEYDIPLAKMLAATKMIDDPENINPGYLFDKGLACWQELYPGEQEDIKEERAGMVALSKEDQKKYLETIQRWNIHRVQKLKQAGWRKVQTI
ncbi:MAG: hypothetical protein KKE17_08505 [Proteobacteria bacterium]|nr:hypothetical protein [Pseudomonadota bacterium]MBU1710028.1 hypothetical protein [Pseudomonadota bacterium]